MIPFGMYRTRMRLRSRTSAITNTGQADTPNQSTLVDLVGHVRPQTNIREDQTTNYSEGTFDTIEIVIPYYEGIRTGYLVEVYDSINSAEAITYYEILSISDDRNKHQQLSLRCRVAERSILPPTEYEVTYLVVGGGGGGGGGPAGGGGGGGGAVEGSLTVTTGAAYIVVIGSGGEGGGAHAQGSNGSGSTITDPNLSVIQAYGGGGGGKYGFPGTAGSSGASGGGGGANFNSGATASGGSGIAGQGFAGGNGNTGTASTSPDVRRGGGGGGASAAGGNASGSGGTESGGTGGSGLVSSITGILVTYGGGGGGGGYGEGGDGKGSGGGGDGGNDAGTNATAGTDGTGGGGGGDGFTNTVNNGGKGIVIIKYAGIPQATYTGTMSTTTTGGFTIHQLTTSGTLTA